jgi:predicted GH43/DUF377 family glycosyl hydrolase
MIFRCRQKASMTVLNPGLVILQHFAYLYLRVILPYHPQQQAYKHLQIQAQILKL